MLESDQLLGFSLLESTFPNEYGVQILRTLSIEHQYAEFILAYKEVKRENVLKTHQCELF